MSTIHVVDHGLSPTLQMVAMSLKRKSKMLTPHIVDILYHVVGRDPAYPEYVARDSGRTVVYDGLNHLSATKGCTACKHHRVQAFNTRLGYLARRRCCSMYRASGKDDCCACHSQPVNCLEATLSQSIVWRPLSASQLPGRHRWCTPMLKPLFTSPDSESPLRPHGRSSRF